MTAPCGCCEGVERVTPLTIASRPGLAALAYRVATHATFLETMLARLSSVYVDVPRQTFDEHGQPIIDRIYPLSALTTRTADDPAIALLDAWATVADVLTFYQERIANEGYLRTATERRSILELARLVGYALRPGVAASVYLAYTLEKGYQVEIPAGSRAQSLPGPGELPQSFETSEKLDAYAEWNTLQVRPTRPQQITRDNVDTAERLFFEGTATNLDANDLLLFVFRDGSGQVLAIVDAVKPEPAQNRTQVTLQGRQSKEEGESSGATKLNDLLDALSIAPSRPEANALRLQRELRPTLFTRDDVGPQLLVRFNPRLQGTLYSAWGAVPATEPAQLQSVNAFRVRAALFGHNAPLQLEPEKVPAGHTPQFTLSAVPTLRNAWHLGDDVKALRLLLLDAVYDHIRPGGWVAIRRPQRTGDPRTTLHKVDRVEIVSASAFGVSTRVTEINLESDWLKLEELDDETDENDKENLFPTRFLRQTTVYAQSEELTRAEEPIVECVGADAEHPENASRIELGRLYDGLRSGRWVIVSGERADIKTPAGETVAGVRASELAMIAGVAQEVHQIDLGDGATKALPGDKTHSFLQLSNPLKYCYKRDTVTIYGNVAKATHGETRAEVLGSGVGSKALQQFALRQTPLTYLSAPTPSGAASTLQVRVNGVERHEAESLASLGRTDRQFITHTDDQDRTTIIFGNGERGARLPTGVENVKAVYRTGIGKGGNVKAEQISLLATRPLGVKGVINPLRAVGGADREGRDQARRNAPLAVMALDRLVSVQDYGDFARTFAGIGKASAVRVSDGHRALVHVTIAGADDIPIEEDSDVFRNLFRALHDAGDPYQPIQLAVRELGILVISANVRVLPDYQWELVAPLIRSNLLDAFGFERRELGQDVFLSEVIRTIQAVEGIDYVDVNTLTAVDEGTLKGLLASGDDEQNNLDFGLPENGRLPVEMAGSRRRDEFGRIRGAQIAFLTPDVPDTLILNPV